MLFFIHFSEPARHSRGQTVPFRAKSNTACPLPAGGPMFKSYPAKGYYTTLMRQIQTIIPISFCPRTDKILTFLISPRRELPSACTRQ